MGKHTAFKIIMFHIIFVCVDGQRHACGKNYNACDFGEWLEWGECTQSCGGGIRTRQKPICCNVNDVSSLEQCIQYCKMTKDQFNHLTTESVSCGETCYYKGHFNRTENKCDCVPGTWGRCCNLYNNTCQGNPCKHGRCISRFPSYSCSCSLGYYGQQCEIVNNECQSNPCKNGRCVPSFSSYYCSCPSGYSGKQCEISVCNGKSCENNGTCQVRRVVQNGRYVYQPICQCTSEYSGDSCQYVNNSTSITLITTMARETTGQPSISYKRTDETTTITTLSNLQPTLVTISTASTRPITTTTDLQSPTPISTTTDIQSPTPPSTTTYLQSPTPPSTTSDIQFPTPPSTISDLKSPIPLSTTTYLQSPTPPSSTSDIQTPTPPSTTSDLKSPIPLSTTTYLQSPTPPSTTSDIQSPTPPSTTSDLKSPIPLSTTTYLQSPTPPSSTSDIQSPTPPSTTSDLKSPIPLSTTTYLQSPTPPSTTSDIQSPTPPSTTSDLKSPIPLSTTTYLQSTTTDRHPATTVTKPTIKMSAISSTAQKTDVAIQSTTTMEPLETKFSTTTLSPIQSSSFKRPQGHHTFNNGNPVNVEHLPVYISECGQSLCQNGTCIDFGSDYVCICTAGYVGRHCEIDEDDCESSPCSYGNCIDKVNDYVCECNTFFSGKNCAQMKLWSIILLSLASMCLLIMFSCCIGCIPSRKKKRKDDDEDVLDANQISPSKKPLPPTKKPPILEAWIH